MCIRDRLNSILTRLVIINQINNSKISVEPIDFKAIVNEVLMLEKKKGLPPDLKITTFIDPQASIDSDKELVRIVLENLIDNAIKFYNDSERVESFMNVHISRVENASVKISGSGNTHINVTEALSARISGSGRVYYTGTVKTLDSHISGSGGIEKI